MSNNLRIPSHRRVAISEGAPGAGPRVRASARRLLDAEPDADHLAEILKALARAHRLRVFARLASCCSEGPPERFRVGELGEGLGIAPSTLSHHLRELRRAGLVQMQKQGQVTECWVEPGTLEDLSSFFTAAACRLLCE